MSWSRVTADRFHTIPASAADERIDPYLVWADLTRMRGFSNLPEFEGQGGLPVLLRVDDRQRWQALVDSGAARVAAPYSEQAYCTAWVSNEHADAFARLNQVGPYELGLPAFSWFLGAPAAAS